MKQRPIAKITALLQHTPVVRNRVRQKFISQFIIALVKSREVQSLSGSWAEYYQAPIRKLKEIHFTTTA